MSQRQGESGRFVATEIGFDEMMLHEIRARYAAEREAHDALALACEEEALRIETERGFLLMFGLLQHAEEEVEEQGAEIVALRNQLREAQARADKWSDCWHETEVLLARADDAAADYHAAWQDAEWRGGTWHTEWVRKGLALHEALKECDDLNNTLDLERAAHQVTAARLAEAETLVANLSRLVVGRVTDALRWVETTL